MRYVETSTRGDFLELDEGEDFKGVIVYDVKTRKGNTFYVLSSSGKLFKLPVSEVLSDSRLNYHDYVLITRDFNYQIHIAKLNDNCPLTYSFIKGQKRLVVQYIKDCKAERRQKLCL